MKGFSSLRAILIFLLSLGLAVPSSAQTGKRKWTVEDVLKQESIQHVDIAPDGNRVLWTKRTPDFEKDGYSTDIFLTFINDPYGSGKPATVQLTRTGDSSNPVWSPDGRHLAFLSSRAIQKDGKEEKKGRQIWLMDGRGGEPRSLTSLENSPIAFAWLDSATILFTAREEPTAYEAALKKAKDDVLVVEDTLLFHPVRLFKLDVASGKIERLTTNDYQIGEFAPSPDGKWVVYSINRSPVQSDARNQPLQYLLDLSTGEATEIFAEKYFDPSGFAWSPDGKGFYASDTYSSDPENEGAGIEELFYFDTATRTHVKVPLDWPNGIGRGGYAVTANGVHVQAADGPYQKPRFYRKTGTGWTFVEVDDPSLRHVTSFVTGKGSNRVVYVYSEADVPPTYHFATYEEGRLTEKGVLTEINAHLKDLAIARAEVTRWKGFGGDEINGILYYPHDYQPGRRYPLIVAIHGGPSSADLDAWSERWAYYPNLLAQKGAFVLMPNYHGSGHHGLEFVESIKGHYYEKEVPDIVNGIEHLVDQGLVDRDSLGVMGWSNGGILTIALTVEHPDLFKAAAPGAGNVNWISDYGNCAFGVRFDDSYFGGAPWERLDDYVKKSPLFRLDRVVTPTLISFGDRDTSVPTEQGWQHYRALQQIGKAPVRFLLFPGQPHGLGRLSHQKRKVEEELAWFDYYLFGRRTLDEDVHKRVVQEGSPLALLDRVKVIKKTEDGLYGELKNGVLVPETVPLGDTLLVGRFEVTRAQFQAFRPGYPVAPGKGNYPATGLTLDDARDYMAWLSKQTGRTYRLPTEKEMKTLTGVAGPAENDLSYWAGYKPNADELKVLLAAVTRHDPDDLLLPVGSRPPGNAGKADAPLLYDTNGNAAEWSTDDKGNGIVLGGSATTFDDPRTDGPDPVPPAFTGFRVVAEPD